MLTVARYICLSWLIFASCGVSAQSASTSREDTARAREVASEYADCVVNRHRDTAVDVTIHSYDSDEFRSRLDNLVNANCMDRARRTLTWGLQFRGNAFRYMLAEGLVRHDYAQAGPQSFGAVPPLERIPVLPLDEAELSRLSESDQTARRAAHRADQDQLALSTVAECTARLAPEATRLIGLTEPNSVEETSAIAAVQPAIGECLPIGTSLRLSRIAVRGELLLNYYRLAYASGENHVQQPIRP